ncbi:GNAT family N-acetyltransferase [Nonomuraea wenchangensis]
MQNNGQASGALQPQIVRVAADDLGSLQRIIDLGDAARRTLGFLPPAAFSQAAERKTLLAVRVGETIAGYALYTLPRQIVRLTHLCIAQEYRGMGLARQLVEMISDYHKDRFGITLRCRTDYKENSLWPQLGFVDRGQRRGRSKAGHPLTIWWKDHGHPDLFSASDSLAILKVAIDLNVFIDIEDGIDRTSAKESTALTANWLADQIELTITPELTREVARLPECDNKRQQVRALSRYSRLATDSSTSNAMYQRLVEFTSAHLHIDLSLTESDRSDVRHIAEAYTAGVTVFATRDENLLRWARAALDICGVRVLRPADVILYIDELARAQAYIPSQLLDTEYRLEPIRSIGESNLLGFLNAGDGERKPDYLRSIRELSAEGRKWERLILRAPNGTESALIVYGSENQRMVVPLMRVGSSRISETITRQLIQHARTQARLLGKEVICVTDQHMPSSSKAILRSEGFVYHDDNWIAFVIDVCADAKTVDEHTSRAAETVDLRLPALTTNLSPIIAADLERSLWPAKILDSALPTFLVPIKPFWSSELFGIPHILTPRSNSLGISREHVYYRSPTPRGERAPARLLWYVSRDASGGSSVIGCSRLEEVTIDTPQILHGRFQHLGVWNRQQVIDASRSGKALALRFADTELFKSHVPLKRLRQIADTLGHSLPLRSVSKISPELFAAIYEEGQAR